MPLWDYLQGGGKRAVAVWHRRAGKDTVAMHWTTVSAFKRPGVYWHMLPTLRQGRVVIWDGRDRNGVPMLAAWPDELIRRRRDDEMKLDLVNDSIWQVVGSDNFDSLVGSNPVGIVFSEWSIADPRAWDYFSPILAENGGWALFIYTPRGAGHGLSMYDMALNNDNWFAQKLGVNDTFAISEEAVDEERARGMSEAMVQQEYFASFDAPVEGAYYADQMLMLQERTPSQISHVSHDPALKVETWWDLGIGDATAIWFAQRSGTDVRLIEYYENSGEPLSHYVSVLEDRAKIPGKKDGYIYSNHVFPPDVRARELLAGKSREEMLRNYGIYPSVVPMHRVEDGIEAVRSLLPRCWFDWKKCERGLAALRQYRKQFNEHTRQWHMKPFHDWTSHAADAFRYGAIFNPPRAMQKLPHRRRSIV